MTTQDLSLMAALVLAVLVLGTLAVVLVATRRARARQAEELATARAEAADLRERVDALARTVEQAGSRTHAPGAGDQRTSRETQEYLITDVGREQPEAPVASRIEGRLFADIVLRESLVKAGALTHGVRRALAPETRNRIRFEMKREVKRSRKQRRAEIRDLRREHAARARSAEDLAG